MSDSLQLVYFPEPGTDPRTTWDPELGIACVYLNAGQIDLRIQFKSRALLDAVRYLRELAAIATDLADQVEQDATAKAVLSS